VHQANYMNDLMKKFNMVELKPVSTLISSAASIGLDEDGEAMDQREYRSMIGSLLYLTATRSDIQFTVGLCARFRAFRLPTFFTSDDSLASFQVSQTHS
jgi:hypothetical protein